MAVNVFESPKEKGKRKKVVNLELELQLKYLSGVGDAARVAQAPGFPSGALADY